MSNVSKLLIKSRYFLSQSPHWCPKRSLLNFVDIVDRTVLAYDPKNKNLKQIQVRLKKFKTFLVKKRHVGQFYVTQR